MPILHRQAGFEFKFYSSDGDERPHVHVLGNGGKAKIRLVPSIEVEDTRGYDEPQMGRILRITEEHHDEWLARWHGFFGSR